jgi:hypothetical protein
MSILNYRRIRIRANTAKFDAPTDVNNSAAVQFWQGSDIGFEFAADYAGSLITDLSNWQQLVIEVRAIGADGKPDETEGGLKMQKVVTVFDDTLDEASWKDATKQHAVALFSGAETNLDPGKYWMAAVVLTTDSPAKDIPLCAGGITIQKLGYPGAGAAPVLSDTAYSKPEADARFLQTANNLSEIADAGSAAQAAARTNLGILASRVVTWDGTFTMAGLPGDRDPVATLAGQPGLALYTGDGTTHGWLFLAGINAA